MLDTAAIIISQGKKIAYAYAEGVNDNMTQSHFHDFFELYYLLEGDWKRFADCKKSMTQIIEHLKEVRQ